MCTVFINMRIDILERKDEINGWIDINQSKAFICRELKCKPETLNSYLDKMGIIYGGNKGGKNIKISNDRKTALEYSKSTCVKSNLLKNKLIEDNVKKHKCENCDLHMWMGKLIPIELHHIDGNKYNNKFTNLQILCPNCHSLTENNSGKNKGNYNK